MEEKIFQIQRDYLEKITQAQTLAELDKIYLSLFGKTGQITLLPKEFSKLTNEEKQRVGPLFNQVKQELEKAVSLKREEVREESYQALENESLNVKEGEIKKRTGHLHPITKFEKEIAQVFQKLGFSEFDAPQIDSDFNNFQVLNIPEDHPARDLQDTLYINVATQNPQPGKFLLRTHTSNSQIRIMQKHQLPIRMMSIGRCFRYEAVDARHSHTFDQFELIYIDKGVSMTNLQSLSEYFLKAAFGKETKARLRPKYYPFVEPGAGVDALCIFCDGKGCKICGGVGWLEIGGAGMIHPQVLKNGGIDPNEYSGIAWGFGPERMIMLKYGVEDIREFNSGDLKFLEKF